MGEKAKDRWNMLLAQFENTERRWDRKVDEQAEKARANKEGIKPGLDNLQWSIEAEYACRMILEFLREYIVKLVRSTEFTTPLIPMLAVQRRDVDTLLDRVLGTPAEELVTKYEARYRFLKLNTENLYNAQAKGPG